MPRAASGNVYVSRGRWYARVKLSAKDRPSIALPTCATKEQADARLVILAELASKLRASERVSIEVGIGLLERAAQREGKQLAAVRAAADALCSGAAKIRGSSVVPGALSPAMTLQELGELWTSGELAKLFPDHVRTKASVDNDVSRLGLYVYPLVGRVAVSAFSLDDGLAVMRAMPPLAAGTRRHVAQLMHRLLGIAVFPARLIAVNPLPPGFLPRAKSTKAKACLHPSEDARLLACSSIPLATRVLYGFLDREGPRVSEALRLTFADFNLDRGAVNLDENKTDDPRTWALDPGVARALRAWRALRGNPPASVLVFADEDGRTPRIRADRFREHLTKAGIDRPDLFDRSGVRMPIRVHDQRAAFITINLALGRSETWISDRTGHKSSQQIQTYRRAARTFAELGLGELAPLDEAIPEFRAGEGAKGGGKGGRAPTTSANRREQQRKVRSSALSPQDHTRRADALLRRSLRARHRGGLRAGPPVLHPLARARGRSRHPGRRPARHALPARRPPRLGRCAHRQK